MAYSDIEEGRAARRRHYQANEGVYKERAKNWTTRARRRNQEFVIQAKQKPCADCGNEYPSYVMDFDHVRGEKVANLGRLVNKPATLEAIANEIAKCDVVCSNCHRIRTHSQPGEVDDLLRSFHADRLGQ
jgi:hypothetical protein